MQKVFITLALVIALSAGASAQETGFGRNKVRYRNFEWSYIQTRHFDIHFYEDAYQTAKFAADVLEKAYQEIRIELNYALQNRVPVFIYNSHNEFQQTNIIPIIVSEGIGGVTESFKNRVAVPFTGSYEDFRHVLHHELTHAVINDMVFGGNLSSLLSRQRLFNLPLWFAEGYAEYSSRHGWDYQSDMYMRDAAVNGYLRAPYFMGGFIVYRIGQAMVHYLVDEHGEDVIHELIQAGRIHLTMNKALKTTLDTDEEELWKDFSKEMKRRYWPTIADLQEADEIGRRLTKARVDGSYFNEKPAFSPEGDKIAIFTDKSDYIEIVLISAKDGKVIKRLAKSARTADLESLHAYYSGMSFSPDGRNIVFVAKSKGKESLFLMDVQNGDIYHKKRLHFQNILSPAWSPDGRKIAFSALTIDKRDIHVYDLDTEEVQRITNDRYDDVEPSWLKNSTEVVFASDRPHTQNQARDSLDHKYVHHEQAFRPGDFKYGQYNIFRVDFTGSEPEPVDVGPGQNRNPLISPDGNKIAFISNRSGIDNIYVGFLDSTRCYAVTDILTGVRHLSWSPDGEQIAFSALFQGAFDVFVLDELVPAGDNGVLAETRFVNRYFGPPAKAGAEVILAGATDSATIVTEVADPLETDSDAAAATDSTVLAAVEDTVATVAGTLEDQPDPTETAEPTDSTATPLPHAETGITGDEYIYVGSPEETALDAVLIDLSKDSAAGPPKEPAWFDSVPPPLPNGEYQINPYRAKLSTDFIGGGFTYDTFFGVRGQTYFVFSDHLGNHQILLATDLVNSLDQSFVQAYYFNNTRRTSLGVGFFHSKNFYEDENRYLFSDRFYGLQGFAHRPFSTFSRIETSLGQFFIDRKYYDRALGDLRKNRTSKITTAYTGYVFDNVVWGSTGPVNGQRFKMTLDGGLNFFDTGDINFYSAGLDYRKYWHFGRTVSMAFRVSGGASFGQTPKLYFLGGTTNWIGTRDLDAQVYDVENLYFASVVTPLRGEDYYGMSGDRYALINWEFRFPTIQVLALRYPLPLVITNVTGVLFADVGSAWFGDDFKGGTSAGGYKRFHDIKSGVGMGLRMNLFGFALVRYDLAWSTDWYQFAHKPVHYFSFGADF